HTNAHVEHLVKFILRHASFCLEQTEYRWSVPGTFANEDVTILRQHAWDIVHETATGDMGQSLDRHPQTGISALWIKFMQQILDQWAVTQMNLEQFSPDGVAQLGQICVWLQLHLLEKNLSSQRITIGVKTAGCQANDEVSGQNSFAIEHPRVLDDADN